MCDIDGDSWYGVTEATSTPVTSTGKKSTISAGWDDDMYRSYRRPLGAMVSATVWLDGAQLLPQRLRPAHRFVPSRSARWRGSTSAASWQAIMPSARIPAGRAWGHLRPPHDQAPDGNVEQLDRDRPATAAVLQLALDLSSASDYGAAQESASRRTRRRGPTGPRWSHTWRSRLPPVWATAPSRRSSETPKATSRPRSAIRSHSSMPHLQATTDAAQAGGATRMRRSICPRPTTSPGSSRRTIASPEGRGKPEHPSPSQPLGPLQRRRLHGHVLLRGRVCREELLTPASLHPHCSSGHGWRRGRSAGSTAPTPLGLLQSGAPVRLEQGSSTGVSRSLATGSVSLALSAEDAKPVTKAGVSSEAAGVAYTEYSVDGGARMRGSRVAVSSTSAHTVAFRSVIAPAMQR